MSRYHPMAELAPRDVVSRAIVSEMRRTGATNVFLDLTHLDAEFVRNRFPRVYKTCLQHGVDIAAVPAPVHPAAHYSMGGVRTDLDGRTNLKALYAAGEVACTGVHGANRLASNSLLEGVVFGARAGAAMRDSDLQHHAPECPSAPDDLFPNLTEAAIRGLAWERCGIIRSGDGLRAACETLESVAMEPIGSAQRASYELRNIHTVALLMAKCALAREESRGGHYRSDFPESREEFQKHSLISRGHGVTFA
jgi:L-aspartate oxidase